MRNNNLRYTGLLLLVFSLSACGTRYPASDALHHSLPAPQPLPTEVSRMLTEGMDYQRQAVSHPEWGTQLELELLPDYFAASGRQCRPFVLHHQDGLQEPRLACLQSRNTWQEVRPVTQLPGAADLNGDAP